MNCPKCATELTERLHEEVSIDVCKSCRGVWLDAGELAKIVERSRPDGDDGDGDGDDDNDDDDDGDDRTNQQPRTGRGRRRERGWFERIGDLFG